MELPRVAIGLAFLLELVLETRDVDLHGVEEDGGLFETKLVFREFLPTSRLHGSPGPTWKTVGMARL
jgi:hypothetical protein